MENKDLKTRRDFFKQASKTVIPIMGFAVLGSNLSLFTSCSKDTSCSDCSAECASSCWDSCIGSSETTSCSECSTSCTNTCNNNCSESCSNSSNNSSNDSISEASGTIDGHEYVDLGLSVKWARCNVNANQPQDNGIAGTSPTAYMYSDEELHSFIVNNGFWSSQGKYFEFAGNIDYDWATYYWGNSWHSPSKTEIEELKNNCIYEPYELNGVKGAKIISKINGNSIFIPLAGVWRENNLNNIEQVGSRIDLLSSTYFSQRVYFFPDAGHFYSVYGGSQIQFMLTSARKAFVRAVTNGSSGPTNCNGNCANTATNSCSSCQIGCSSGCTQQCSSNCSTGCKTDCTSNCPNGCNTLCGGSCHYSCGGSCSYASSGSHCTSGTCATTCSNYCYRTCTLACSESCMSCCITSSK